MIGQNEKVIGQNEKVIGQNDQSLFLVYRGGGLEKIVRWCDQKVNRYRTRMYLGKLRENAIAL